MADLTPEEIERLRQKYEDIGETLEKAGVQVKKFANKTIKDIDAQFARLDKTVKNAGGSFKDATNQLAELADAIEDSAELQQNANAKKAALDKLEAKAVEARKSIVTDMYKKMAGDAIGAFANYYANQLRVGIADLMGSASPFKMATDLQVQAVTDIGAAGNAIATGAAEAGGALMMIPEPASKVAGGLLMLGGAFGAFMASKATELFKLKVQTIGNALESTYNSFMEASSAGAMFAGGLTELRQQALKSGLTQEQFTKIVADNRDNLAKAGYTVADGAKILGNVTQSLASQVGPSGKKLRDELLNLGFSIEEQAAISTDVIAQLKRSGATATNAEVAQATATYAKNLRVIADITGEDAKKRVEDAKKITEEYAFQRKFLREHNGNINALNEATQALALMGPTARQSIQQAYLFGGAVRNQSAHMMGMVGAAQESANVMHKQNFNMEEMASSMARFNTEFRERGIDPVGEAVASYAALTGNHADMAQSYSETLQNAYKLDERNLKNAIETSKKAAATGDPFTAGVKDSVVALQNMRNSIEKDLTGAITKFATDVPEILKGFREKLVEMGILESTLEKPEDIKTVKQARSADVSGKYMFKSDESVLKKEKAEAWMKQNNVSPLERYNYELNGIAPKGMPAFADGGIAAGPVSGYQAELHGTEAVVPLPDNRNIPVSLDSSSLTNALQEQTGLIKDLLTAMNKNNSLTSGILKQAY